MTRRRIKPRTSAKGKYRCTACGQTAMQSVGWTTCPHCNRMGTLEKVDA